jgi:hypothetical protein
VAVSPQILRLYTRRRAQHYGLDPDIEEAQFQQESGFNPNARSPAGALGAAQIMPETAASWGVDPMRPRKALDVALRHMAQYYKQYGNMRDALIAYNAGPGAVGRSLPAETQNYIRTILGGRNPRSPRSSPVASVTSTGSNVSSPDVGQVLQNYIQATQGLFNQPIGGPNAFQSILPEDPGAGIARTVEALQRITGKTETPGVESPSAQTSPGSLNLPTNVRGKVTVAPGANRAGVGLQKPLMSFLGALSHHAGAIHIGTGTNHNRMTLSGNVSDHWDGNAADLPMPVDSRQGDLMAAHAISLAGGIPFQKALQLAERGGVFNFETKAGRVQILWKTMVGGNHHNHVHIGLNPNR